MERIFWILSREYANPAPIPQLDAPHIIAAAQIFFDQTGSAFIYRPTTDLLPTNFDLLQPIASKLKKSKAYFLPMY